MDAPRQPVSDEDLDQALDEHGLALPAADRENVLATMRFLKGTVALVQRFNDSAEEADS